MPSKLTGGNSQVQALANQIFDRGNEETATALVAAEIPAEASLSESTNLIQQLQKVRHGARCIRT